MAPFLYMKKVLLILYYYVMKLASTSNSKPWCINRSKSNISSAAVSRKERQGTKLSTAVIPTPTWAEKPNFTSPQSSADSTAEDDDEDDAMEKRLKACYSDDTFGKFARIASTCQNVFEQDLQVF